MDGAAIFFWVGMAGLLAGAILLGRWHAEDMAGRMAGTHGRRTVRLRGDAPARQRVVPRGMGRRDAALPDEPERAA